MRERLKKLNIYSKKTAMVAAFIPLINMIYLWFTAFTMRPQNKKVYPFLVGTLIVASLMLRFLPTWIAWLLMYAMFAISVILVYQFFGVMPPKQTVQKWNTIFAVTMLIITPMLFIFDHQTEEKMKPICENALQTIENNDAKSWAKQLHPECSEEMRDLKQLRKALAGAVIPEEGEWKVGSQIASEVQSLDGNKRIAVSYQVTKAGKPYVVKIIYLSDSDGEGVFRLSVGIG